MVWKICVSGPEEPVPEMVACCPGLACSVSILPRLEISVLPPAMEMGLFTSVMVLVTPPTIVVTTCACWVTVTVPDLCTVIMGLAGAMVVATCVGVTN